MDVLAIQIKIIEGRRRDQRYRTSRNMDGNVAGDRLKSCHLGPDEISKGWAKVAANACFATPQRNVSRARRST
jgi:hypothetical protein